MFHRPPIRHQVASFIRAATIPPRTQRAPRSFPRSRKKHPDTSRPASSSHRRRSAGNNKRLLAAYIRLRDIFRSPLCTHKPLPSSLFPLPSTPSSMARESRDVFHQPSAGTVTRDEPPPGIGRGVSGRTFFGHPVGLSTLFFTEMWERFSYYGIRPLLVLFMTAALAQGGFGFERTTASSIVGIYAACVYLASLPGGWIADRLLGLRQAIWYGGILIALGHLSIALSDRKSVV